MNTDIFKFTINSSSKNSSARTGVFTTAHGDIQTPVFMPVGTKGSVKGLTMDEVKSSGAEIILGNTYHLYLRPGPDLIDSFGGLHKFTTWDKPMLTDSGGFQVFSLGKGMGKRGGKDTPKPLVKITEEGVHFQSYLDGSRHFFTPESVMEYQAKIGGDICMAFDECPPSDSERAYLEKSMALTHRWAERSKAAFLLEQEKRKLAGVYSQALFPIVQGGRFADLRAESAKFIGDLNMPGNAIGGLSVGESKDVMYEMIEVVDSVLPKNKPRYLMGVGTPEDILEGIRRGIDMFDCVLPTRIGRHGAFFTHDGVCDITNAVYKNDPMPLDSECDGFDSLKYSRAYIRHLFIENEMLALRVLSLHNIAFLIMLTQKARKHIMAGTYERFMGEFLARYLNK